MQRRNIPDKKIILVYLSFLLLMVPFLIMAHRAGYNTDTNRDSNETAELADGWSVVSDKGMSESVSLPINDDRYCDGPITLSRILTAEECRNGNYLMFLAYHASVVMRIDGNVKYDFGTTDKVFSMSPSAYHFLKLDASYIGKTLTITMDSDARKFRGKAEMVYLGDRSSEIIMILKKNIFAVYTYTVLLAISMLFFAAWFFLELFSGKYRDDSLLFLSLTALFLFIGGINDTKLTQFIFNDIEALCILNYEVIMLMEMSVVAYLLCSSNTYVVKMTKKVAVIPVINIVLSNALFVFHIVDLESSLIITHICLVMIAVSEIYINAKVNLIERKRIGKKGLKPSMDAIGFFAFALMVCIDIIRYYMGNTTDYAACTRIGVIIYIALLGVKSMQGHMDILTVEKQSQTYKQMALHDGLTNLSNRTAYQERLAYLNASDTGHIKTIVAMFDINDLKKMNDVMGHDEGDRYIKDCAYFINSFFRDFSTLFRIGGDEFSVICSLDDKKKFYSAYEEMQKKYAEADRKRINFAYGYAEFDSNLDRDLYDTSRRADKMMYDCKNKMKRNEI